MNGKQRVKLALARREPDRVPVNYMGNPGITRRLCEHFGIDFEAPDRHDRLMRALGVDFRHAGAHYAGPRLHAEPDDPSLRVSPDWGIQTRYVEHGSGGYWEPFGSPLKALDLETARTYPLPSPDDYDYEPVRQACADCTEHAIGTHIGFEVMNYTARLTGDETMYVGLAMGDPALLTFVERFTEIKREILRRTLEAADGKLDFVGIGEDLGTQRGPRISMDLFRERIRPVHEKSIALIKCYDLPVMIHSCGSSSWAFEEFIDMGIDAVDTLQPEATDMDPAYLKETYGDRLAFHGCISTAGPVAYGSVEDVVEDVHETLDVMMPGGGYALAPTHQLQDNSPTANVVAMYETARSQGWY